MPEIPIYLASKSPRRKMLLQQLGIKFRPIIPTITERINEKNPKKFAVTIARDKVLSVAKRVRRGIIIGVDTIVVVDDEILGKPSSKEEAYDMINRLNDRAHQVISGLYILCKPDQLASLSRERSGKVFKSSEKTIVHFRKLSEREIINYINTDEPYDKAGGYGIQGRAGYFIKNINGCYYNVVGLPITKLLAGLKKLSAMI